MSETTHLCGAILICPECGEEVRNIPPADMAPGYASPDFSHQDTSTLCPDYNNGGGRRPASPVAFLPTTVLTRT